MKIVKYDTKKKELTINHKKDYKYFGVPKSVKEEVETLIDEDHVGTVFKTLAPYSKNA